MEIEKNLRAAAVAAMLGLGLPAGALAQQPANGAPTDTSGNAAGMQLAQRTYADVIVSLENNGYEVIEMTTTFLGRARILAKSPENLREVVVSRSTGAIKSDVILETFAEVETGAGVSVGETTAAAAGSGSFSSALSGLLGGATSLSDDSGAASLGGSLGGSADGSVAGSVDGAVGDLDGSGAGTLGGSVGGALGGSVGGAGGSAGGNAGGGIGGGGGLGVGL